MTFVFVVVFAKFFSLEAAALLAKEKINKSFLDTSAEPKSEPPDGPKNGSGLICRNSSGAQYADPKTGPRERAGTSFGTSSFAALARAVLVDLDS